jgi:hypothetical protein
MSQQESRETNVHVARSAPARLIWAWAIGETRAMTERERKLTAAVFAQLPGVLDHVRRERCLPSRAPGGGRETMLRALIDRRGFDIELSAPEREVYAVLGADAEVPAERAAIFAYG